jgi:hypothetical protein
MKIIMSSLFYCIIFSVNLFSQSIEVNKKTGLITVENKDEFYLVSKNKFLFIGDYSLQNLNGLELAYLKVVQKENSNNGSEEFQFNMNMYYSITFTQSANQCNIYNFNGFNLRKSIAKIIYNAGLIKNNVIDAQAEEKFISERNGIFNPANETTNEIIKKGPGIIHFNAEKIYENEEFIGTFITSKSNDSINIVFYNSATNLVCQALRSSKDTTDWVITFPNQIIHTIPYNAENPLMKLVSYLIELKQL